MTAARIALTLGDPAGIGPDIALQVMNQNVQANLVIFGSKSLLRHRAQLLKLDPNIVNHFEIIDIPLNIVNIVTPGVPNSAHAPWVINSINLAIEACLNKNCDALVTGPVHKGILNEGGFSFLGHTEYLAHKTNTSTVVMSFFSSKLILGLLTTHLPLRDVIEHVHSESLYRKLTIFYHAIKHYLKRPPKIAVLGLNPHAGENGFLGQEEIEIITPTIHRLAKEGLILEGPLSADSAFSPLIRGQYDALFAMYHDQGLCGLKAIDFGDSVNVTLGLPFIRTSVDHGTAFDKAGTLNANPNSLAVAIRTAQYFFKDR